MQPEYDSRAGVAPSVAPSCAVGRSVVSAVEAVERDLARLPSDLAGSAVAASMFAMARVLDGEAKGSVSECSKALLDAWSKLRDLAPEEVEADGIDDLTERRRRRRKTA